MTVTPFDPENASPDSLAALHAFTTRLRAELLPDEPPTALAQAVATWRGTARSTHGPVLLAWEDGRVIARGQAIWPRTDLNAHAARVSVEVLPEHRRSGHARALLAPLAAAMREAGRTLAIAETSDRSPAGEALLEAIGAGRGLVTHVHQLRLADVDRGLLARWQAGGATPDERYALDGWDGPHPQSELPAIAALSAVMESAPKGTLQVDVAAATPARLRQVESMLAARGAERWTLCVRERETGALAGFTEVYWLPTSPEVVHQGDTGVLPAHRGRGLGRRLKAAMIERILAERPQARLVRTSNADANAPMLAINRAMGFAPYVARTVWQAPREALERWLAGAR